MESASASGSYYGNSQATILGNTAAPPSLRGVCSRIEELHKEADSLLALASDLVGHEPEKDGARINPVSSSLVDQLHYSISQLSTKLASAREKFQRGHGC